MTGPSVPEANAPRTKRRAPGAEFENVRAIRACPLLKILPRIPLRRWGTPDDFSALAVWLASPGSAYFTGQTVVMDGGYTVF